MTEKWYQLAFHPTNHLYCLIIHSNRKLELCQQQNVAELIYFVCLAVNASEGSTTFVIKALLNK